MQELAQISCSPFGSRPLSSGMLKTNALVRDCAPGTQVRKWSVFRDISAARPALGIPDRALIVLNALLSFHPEATLTAGAPDVVVFPSNRHLSLRSHGMAASTLRRHLAALVDHGLILRRDSPNGKRFARKSADGEVEVCYGFDLGPIVARAAEFNRIARAIEEQARLLRNLRQRFTVLRRDIVKMIAAGVEASIAIDWAALHAKYQAIVARVPRTPTKEALDPIVIELQDLADHVLGVLDSHLGEPAVAAPDGVDVDASASPRSLTLHPAPSTDPDRNSWTDRQEAVPLRVVLDACPDIIDYARGKITSYRALLTTAALVRPLLGISASAWEEAGQIMGEPQAAIIVAAILQRGVAIKNPGGYLRNLTRRAGAGQFSVWPMLMALSAARLKKAT
ncbi:plasmid replication protein RepC [Rhizobium multihospitium]|uniref:Replication initiation protein RepC n=1 Tax=Rhizobium multihospitium TaxID=410764 RepID=A0A1C3XDM1_9HYPH|nr:plasmid replication protein RepC [Rhizobium multihospitium]SCB50338.1 replication initiation protein RepC [Rhizobium multihospitium]